MTWDGTPTPDTGNANSGNTPEWNAFLQNAENYKSPATSSGVVAGPAEGLPAHSPDNSPAGVSAFMAPYMKQAHQIFGQNPVFGNSAFGKTPLGAGITAAVEAGTQARAGATIGDSIGVASRMLMAPGQYNREVALNEQDYVNKRVQANFGIQKDLSQISENNARAAYMTGAQSELAEARANRLNNPPSKSHFGPPEQQNDGSWLQPEYDSATGKSLGMQAVPGRIKPTGASNPNRDTTTAGIIRRLADPDPAVRQQAQLDQDASIRMAGGVAGGRAQGAADVNEPIKENERFLQNERQLFTLDHPKDVGYDAWETGAMKSKDFDFEHPMDQYAKYQQGVSDQVNKRTADFSRYETSAAWKNGIGYQDWKNGKSPAKQSAPSTDNPPSSGAPNTSWTPPK